MCQVKHTGAAEEVTLVTCAVFSHGKFKFYTVSLHSLYVNITYSSD